MKKTNAPKKIKKLKASLDIARADGRRARADCRKISDLIRDFSKIAKKQRIEWRVFRWRKIYEMREAGKTFPEIARYFGICVTRARENYFTAKSIKDHYGEISCKCFES